ncbi:MAG: lysylphosphatidylglycerol synthase transmembrane domain-containing protein [Acidimicrobiales bacterium]
MTASPARRGIVRRIWPWLKYIVGLALAALAIYALTGRRGELSGASFYLDHLNAGWIVLAVAAEAASLVAFAIIQQRLLAAGDVRTGLGPMVAVTAAATAIANSMPAGPVVSSVFAFRQYRRRGADDALAGWTLVAVFVVASVSLAVVAAIGLAVAGAEGAGLDLVGVTVGVLVGALVLGALFVQRRAFVWALTALLGASERVVRWPRGDTAVKVEAALARLVRVELSGRQVAGIGGWGIANWVLDCGCLGLSFLAVGVGVPWQGLLLAYGAGQLAANLPITPGGLGVVEGSLTIALVAFGGAENSTVAAVLLYRIISFWAELPIGWGTWAALAWSARRVPVLSGAVAGDDDMAEVLA